MEYVNFNDSSIPIGKRKQAFVKWAMSNGTSLRRAQTIANRKFGFERKGKYLVKLINADCMDLSSFRDFTWEDACRIDFRKAESVVICCDVYYAPFEAIKGFFSEYTLFGNLPDSFDDADNWAKENGYQVIERILLS